MAKLSDPLHALTPEAKRIYDKIFRRDCRTRFSASSGRTGSWSW